MHNFWLFSFERFNGVLGDFKKNQRAVEIQLMRKFLREQDIRDLPFPTLFKEQLGPVFTQMKATVMDPVYNVSSAAEYLSLSQGPVAKGDLWFDSESLSCISPHRMDYLDDDELNYLMHSYSAFLQGVKFQNGTAIFDRYAGVEFLGSVMVHLTHEVSGLPISLLPAKELPVMETLIRQHVMHGLV